MAKLTLEEAKDFSVLPDESLIRIRVDKIAPKEVPGKDGKEGWTKLEFTCTILELPPNLAQDEGYADLVGTTIWASTGMKFTMHPDNKLRQWAEALLNMGELDAGFELDTDILEGREARAVTGLYTRKDGQQRHQINGMLPAGQLGAAQQPQFATTAPAQDPWAAGAADDDPPF